MRDKLKLNYTIYIILIFVNNLLFCQDKLDNIWLFGRSPNDSVRFFGGSKIEFIKSKPLISYFNTNFDFDESAMICDNHGKLVAYTNGCNVQNGSHKLMENGDTLFPGNFYNNYCDTPHIYYPTRNSEIFIPKIGSKGFLLFQSGRANTGYMNRTQYTEIEPDGNEYTVISKSNILNKLDVAQGIQAIRHGNGRDWWIILKWVPGRSFIKFLYTKDSILGPYFQEIGPIWNEFGAIVQTSFSPNGKWFAMLSEHNGMSLFRFNRCTGYFTEYIKLNHPRANPTDWYTIGGVCFSPNSQYLYVSALYGMHQYDLGSSDIPNSSVLVDTVDFYFRSVTPFPSTFYQLLLGPDGRIYCNTHNATNFLHVIHFPDKRGKDCMLRQHDLYLPAIYFQSMPNFAHYRTYDWDGSNCDTLGINKLPLANYRFEPDSIDYKKIEFVELSAHDPTEWYWNFGDPKSGQNLSNEKYPIHVFSENGVYNVCLTVINRHGSNQYCDTLNIGTVVNNDEIKIEVEQKIVMMPNPCSDVLEIQIHDFIPQNMTVQITDLTGKNCIKKRIYQQKTIINLEQLIHGIYMVHIFENGKLHKKTMVVKQ